MYSFYGGRPGNSFIIITSFPSVQDMITKFKKGPAYSDVHFDEHVIINTNNKNDPDNGKIFRRGYNYTAKDENGNDTGGAIPIGQIVGPAGPAPTLFLDNYDTVENKKTFDPTINSEKINENTGSYTIDNSSLVPGYEYNENTGTEKFNDEIQWTFCSIKTEDDGECVAYIGFKIPYLVIDWEVESTSAYENPTIEQSDDSIEHPFYKKWKLGIPQGKHGTSLSNLRVKKYNLNEDEDLKTFDGQNYSGTENSNIIIYDQTSYNNETPVVTKKYLGDYNIIQDIKHQNGKLLIKCSNDEDNYQKFSLKQIESIDLNEETGQFTIKYYNNNKPTTFSLRWVKDVEFNQDEGALTFKYANSTTQETKVPINWIKSTEIKQVGPNDTRQFLYLNWINPIENSVSEIENKTTQLSDFRWIKKLNLTDDGILVVTYNDNETQELNSNNPINWIKSIGIDPETHRLICVTNGTRTFEISTDNVLKWIDSVSINEDGILTIYYNAGEPTVLENYPIKWINSTSLSTDGTLTINYNTNESQSMSNAIRWISNVSKDENGNITVSYNYGQSDNLGTIRQIKEVEINENNHLIITYSDLQDEIDVGSVAANLTFLDEYAYNLNCSGIGQIIVNTEENQGIEETKKYINFTSSTTSLIGDRNIQVLSPGGGEVQINKFLLETITIL